jgi:modulator of FtsH protease HflK
MVTLKKAMLRPVRALLALNDNGWGKKPDQDSGQQRPKDNKPTNNSNNNDGPPDLDKVWQDFNRRLGGLFGGKKSNKNPFGGNNGGGGGNGGLPNFSGRGAGIGLGLLAATIGVLWLASGFFILPEGQAAAVLRFGEFKSVSVQPGIRWRLPYPIESHEIVNVQELRQVEVGYRNNVKQKQPKESLMLTKDQSIVDLQFAAQYRISNPADYLFNNRPLGEREEILRQAAETSMRATVGIKNIDQVLYAEKDEVAKQALKEMQSILDRYKAGVTIIDLTIQQAQPPEQVQAAFEDANKAAQDKERFINEGIAYANDVIPKAKGTAARLLEESEGYRARVVATAEGDAARFKSVQAEFSKAPQVTRERMYLETMQQIYANATKVYVDTKGGGNGGSSLLYLPLDKLIQQTAPAPVANAAGPEPIRPPASEGSRPEARAEDVRSRDIRNR